jgi:hypothetical protein
MELRDGQLQHEPVGQSRQQREIFVRPHREDPRLAEHCVENGASSEGTAAAAAEEEEEEEEDADAAISFHLAGGIVSFGTYPPSMSLRFAWMYRFDWLKRHASASVRKETARRTTSDGSMFSASICDATTGAKVSHDASPSTPRACCACQVGARQDTVPFARSFLLPDRIAFQMWRNLLVQLRISGAQLISSAHCLFALCATEARTVEATAHARHCTGGRDRCQRR